MANHHLLCVHGVGDHSDNWVTSEDQDTKQTFKDCFLECWDKYDELSPSENLVFHSVHYDDILLRALDSWDTLLEQLSALAPTPRNTFSNKLYKEASRLSAKSAQNSFVKSHLMDLLLFYTIPSITDAVITHVGQQCLDIISAEKSKGGKPIFSVIGHSMGTAVVEKTLKALFSEKSEKIFTGSKDTLEGDFSFYAVILIANTSFTLARDNSEEMFYRRSKFKPGDSVGSICKKMLNINHTLDPIGRFRPFSPPKNWLNTDDEGLYVSVLLSELSSPYVHSINHYMRDACAHTRIFNALEGDLTIKQPDATGSTENFKSIAAALKKLIPSEDATIMEFIKMANYALNLEKNYSDELKYLLGGK